MAKFRQIQTNFWSNPYIQEEMTAEDKFFYLYLMTNEFTTQIGIYPITKKQIAFDLGYSIESVKALIQRFETYHKLIKYDPATREIILLEWAKNNLNIGGKPVQDLIKKEIEQVSNKEFLKLMYGACPENDTKKFIRTLIELEAESKNKNEKEEIDESLEIKGNYEPCYEPYNETGAINNKEEIINNKNNNKEKINKKEKKEIEDFITSLNKSEEYKALLFEFLKYRRKRKETIKTTGPIKLLIKHFKDETTLREALEYMDLYNWKTAEPEWILNKKNSSKNNGKSNYKREKWEITEEGLREYYGIGDDYEFE